MRLWDSIVIVIVFNVLILLVVMTGQRLSHVAVVDANGNLIKPYHTIFPTKSKIEK